MTAIFWLGSFPLESGFPEGLRSLGLKIEWVQEAHLLGDAPELPIQPAYRWPVGVSSSHRLLHFACQTLLSGDLEVLLLAGGGQAALLASPKAVGRWNLTPRASLSSRLNYRPDASPDQYLAALALRLMAAEIDPEQAGLALALEQAEPPLAPAFPAVAWMAHDQPNFLAALNHLCAALEERSTGLGLLFTPGLATVIERI